mmetsp:Transcript_58259/g.103946  ORF Transcript_58259/g.103946 Transcript_58259/m.103946 type:complete len:241 (-) Transcript_58259:1245-1967(-)
MPESIWGQIPLGRQSPAPAMQGRASPSSHTLQRPNSLPQADPQSHQKLPLSSPGPRNQRSIRCWGLTDQDSSVSLMDSCRRSWALCFRCDRIRCRSTPRRARSSACSCFRRAQRSAFAVSVRIRVSMLSRNLSICSSCRSQFLACSLCTSSSRFCFASSSSCSTACLVFSRSACRCSNSSLRCSISFVARSSRGSFSIRLARAASASLASDSCRRTSASSPACARSTSTSCSTFSRASSR